MISKSQGCSIGVRWKFPNSHNAYFHTRYIANNKVEIDIGVDRDIIIGKKTLFECKTCNVLSINWAFPDGTTSNSIKFKKALKVEPGFHTITITVVLFGDRTVVSEEKRWFVLPFGSKIETELDIAKLKTVLIAKDV